MKILKVSGIVVAIHVALFLLVFAIPGCHSTGKTTPANVAIADSPPAAATAPGGGPLGGQDLNPPLALAPAPMPPALGFDPDAPAGPRFNPVRPDTAEALALAPPPPQPLRTLSTPVASASVATRHVVVSGESLWTIAKKYSVKPAYLAKANNLSVSAVLHPGQKLLVPDSGHAAESAPATVAHGGPAVVSTPVASSSTATTHVIKSGETLGAIAKSYGVKVGDLEVANHITNPAMIRVGQTLKIPGTGNSAKSVSASSPAPADAAIVPAPAPPAPPLFAPVDLHFTGLPAAPDTSSGPSIRPAPPPPPAGPTAPDQAAPVIKVEDGGAPLIQ